MCCWSLHEVGYLFRFFHRFTDLFIYVVIYQVLITTEHWQRVGNSTSSAADDDDNNSVNATLTLVRKFERRLDTISDILEHVTHGAAEIRTSRAGKRRQAVAQYEESMLLATRKFDEDFLYV